MQRYFGFFLGAFLIIGSGCHTVTGPVQNNSEPLVSHYPMVNIIFKNIIMSRSHSYSDVYRHDNSKDTALCASSPSYDGNIREVYNGLFSDSSGVLKQDTIAVLKAQHSSEYSVKVNFVSIALTHQQDNSLSCILSGLGAAQHIIAITDFKERQFSGGQGTIGDEQYFRQYFQCTDSTYIVITFPYKN